MQTRTGAKKATANILAKDPDFFKKIGSKGGSRKVAKGFSVSGKASSAGRLGGSRKLHDRMNSYATVTDKTGSEDE